MKFGHPLTRSGMSRSCDSMLAGPAVLRDIAVSKTPPSEGKRNSHTSLDGQNRQSPAFSERGQLSQAGFNAVPHGTNVKRVNANRAMRIAAQQTQGL